MPIIRMSVGDLLELKKNHPCGSNSNTFAVLRVGSVVRIRCTVCGRDMEMDRLRLEKSVRRLLVGGCTPDKNKTNPQ